MTTAFKELVIGMTGGTVSALPAATVASTSAPARRMYDFSMDGSSDSLFGAAKREITRRSLVS